MSDAANKVAGLVVSSSSDDNNNNGGGGMDGNNDMALVPVATKRSDVEREAARSALHKDVLEWSEDDVHAWATGLGCHAAADALRAPCQRGAARGAVG